MYKHLRHRKSYEERYDRMTVEACRHTEEFIERFAESKEGKKVKKEELNRICHFEIYFQTGEYFIKKNETIENWMQRDRKRDEMYQNTPIPEAKCFLCNKDMELISKMLSMDFDKDRDYMNFSFVCRECKVTSHIKDGKRTDRAAWQCPDCKRRLNTDSKRTKDKIVVKDHCDYCGYHHEDEIDLSTSSKLEKWPSKEEIQKYNEDKFRFCLSDKEGFEYAQAKQNLLDLTKLLEKEPTQEPKIKRLSIKEVQKILKQILNYQKYENITFSEPDTTRDITFSFKAIDSKDRTSHDVKRTLKKAIRTKLEGTNWSMMSSCIQYRLGVVEAKFKGREVVIRESDGAEII